MKRRWIALVFATIAISSVLVWLCKDTGESVILEGNVSNKDLSEIKSAVRRDLRQRLLPDISWNGLKHYPGRLASYMTLRFKKVSLYSNAEIYPKPFVEVTMGPLGHKDDLNYDTIVFDLSKETNQWKLFYIGNAKGHL